jgi:hypothetical protein
MEFSINSKNSLTYWLGIREESSVDFVYSGEISHISQEDVDFDSILKTRAARF